MTLPTSHHVCQGCAIGTTYYGWAAARYQADATPLACRLTDRDLWWEPQSQTVDKRRWIDVRTIPTGESTQRNWAGAIDDSGHRFH